VFVRLRELSEAECYVRCYGRGDVNVTVFRSEPTYPDAALHLSGEQLRRLFEARLDAREPEAEAEAA
jgi:hypothetical protein